MEESYNPTVCQDSNDCDEIKQVLPDTYSASSFCERTTPHFANLVRIESHAREVIKKDQEGDTTEKKRIKNLENDENSDSLRSISLIPRN